MDQLESIALAAFLCLGGLVLLVVLPVIIPLLAQLLGFIFELFSSCLHLVIGVPLGCGCSCLLFLLLAVGAAAVGLVLIDQACAQNPVGLCSLLGY